MINITKFENIDYYFSDVINEMANDFLRILFEKNREDYLTKFEKMLEAIRKHSNLNDLINEYKKRQLNDYDRFYSLLSEIRAAYLLLSKGLPVTFYDCTQTNKAADIQSIIKDIPTYIEVKRVSKRIIEAEKIEEELKKIGVQYLITITLPKLGYLAENVAKKIDEKIKELEVENFPTDDIEFKYGSFRIIQPDPKNGVNTIQSFVIPYERTVAEGRDEADISLEQIFGGIISDLDDALKKFDATSNENDMCFVLIDNHDIDRLDQIEMQEFLYSGVDISIAGNKEVPILSYVEYADELGWNEFLVNLGFLPGKHKFDYSDKKGWFLYSEESKYLNGIFFLEGGTFKYNKEWVFLNPFVKKQRNYCELQDMFDYYRLND